jgi:hypothetical protein
MAPHTAGSTAKRFATVVADNTFNDTWDCKPWFNVNLIDNPHDLANHFQWYLDISRRSGGNLQGTAARCKFSLGTDHP